MRKGKIEQWEKDIIIDLRNKNIGYTEIAEQLNCKKDRVKDYCQRNNLGGHRSTRGKMKNATLADREKKFKEDFEKLFPDFKYHSGFTSVDKPFFSECRQCGYIIERNAQCIRRDKEVQCDNCNNAMKNRKMVIELLNRLLKAKQKEIDNDIRLEIESLRRIGSNHKHYLECKECGRMYFSNRERITCSERCGNKRGNRIGEIRRRKRIVENGRVDWNISIERLIKRDGDNCYLCGEKVDMGDYYIKGDDIFISGNKYPSVDHVIPISKGGTHTWDNVKLAHRDCNSSKSDNTTIEIEDTGQVVMVM